MFRDQVWEALSLGFLLLFGSFFIATAEYLRVSN